MLRAREAAGADILRIGLCCRPDGAGHVGIVLDEARDEVGEQAESVLAHQDLAVTGGRGPDPDRRHLRDVEQDDVGLEPLRQILRAGSYELLARPDIPTGSVISEYLDVAHAFFDRKEKKFVNGVLDAVARSVRS
mgnify:CR=1 FL=1